MNLTSDERGQMIGAVNVCYRNERVALVDFATKLLVAINCSEVTREGEQGGAMVELALTLPVLLLIVTCIFSFGIAMNNYLELTDATAIGSRLVAISRGQTTDPCAEASTAIYAAAPYLKADSLSFTFVFNGVSYYGNTCSSSSITSGAAGNMTSGSTAQVTVTYPCNITVYGHNYAPSCTLTASTTELVQ